jgi:hypothetical protein
MISLRHRGETWWLTVLALECVYYLDGKKATLIPMSDDTSILAYEEGRVIKSVSLASTYLSMSVTHSTST